MELIMRTTLDLPEALIQEAMSLTKIKTKTELIKFALEEIVYREKIKGLKDAVGKIDLDIDIDVLRGRGGFANR